MAKPVNPKRMKWNPGPWMKSYLTGAEHKKVSELFKETMNEHVFNLNNPESLTLGV